MKRLVCGSLRVITLSAALYFISANCGGATLPWIFCVLSSFVWAISTAIEGC